MNVQNLFFLVMILIAQPKGLVPKSGIAKEDNLSLMSPLCEQYLKVLRIEGHVYQLCQTVLGCCIMLRVGDKMSNRTIISEANFNSLTTLEYG